MQPFEVVVILWSWGYAPSFHVGVECANDPRCRQLVACTLHRYFLLCRHLARSPDTQRANLSTESRRAVFFVVFSFCVCNFSCLCPLGVTRRSPRLASPRCFSSFCFVICILVISSFVHLNTVSVFPLVAGTFPRSSGQVSIRRVLRFYGIFMVYHGVSDSDVGVVSPDWRLAKLYLRRLPCLFGCLPGRNAGTVSRDRCVYNANINGSGACDVLLFCVFS